MKATELRIGNLVGFEDDIEHYVVNRGILDNIAMDWEYKPIPLTEEWFNRFGFEKTTYIEGGWLGGMEIEKFQMGCFYLLNACGKGGKYGIGMHEVWDGISLIVDYVHQLQNLYFALTGEELELDKPRATASQ